MDQELLAGALQQAAAQGTMRAVQQNSGGKLQPLLNYCELNDHATDFTTDSDVCADQQHKWHCHGVNMAFLDPCKAYLEVRVDQQLWLLQTVMV